MHHGTQSSGVRNFEYCKANIDDLGTAATATALSGRGGRCSDLLSKYSAVEGFSGVAETRASLV